MSSENSTLIRNKISIFSLLKAFNLIVFILMIYVYIEYGNNQYINQGTIWINGLQCLLSHFVLNDAEKNNNHLLAVLAFVMVVHFEFRIVSLNYTEFSEIIKSRVKIDAHGINWILLYVLASYFLTWIGIRFSKTKIHEINDKHECLKNRAAKNILFLLYISFFLMLLSAIGVPGISHIVGILSVYFLNMNFMLLFGIGFFLYRWKDVSRSEKIWFIAFLLIYIVVFTGIGRRSTIYGIAIMTFFSMLAFDKIYLKRRYVLYGFVLLPLMVWMFTFSTFTRQNRQQTLSVADAVALSRELSDQVDWNDTRMILAPVFNRIAFFDFTVEMVQNYDHLKNYLTPGNYIKSVVDNLLTPGFDLFDMPKMSYVITKSYSIQGPPSSKRYNIDENFQSDATSWYGEAYLLFGKYLAFPVILLVAVLTKNLYLRVSKKRSLTSMWKRTIILYLFYTLLYSYGLDWWLIYLVAFIINYEIFKSITRANRQTNSYLISDNSNNSIV